METQQVLVYFEITILCLLMAWWHKDPWQQQACYLTFFVGRVEVSFCGIFSNYRYFVSDILWNISQQIPQLWDTVTMVTEPFELTAMRSLIQKSLNAWWNYFFLSQKINVDEPQYFDGIVQDCSISSAKALEILQSCAKPSICKDMCWSFDGGLSSSELLLFYDVGVNE